MFILVKNTRDHNTYDICTIKNNGEYTVWGNVIVDFATEIEVADAGGDFPTKIRIKTLTYS
jgi:hypothetical protein